jgi:3-deoxy-7-phosphoheptulonate synthase
MIITMRKGTTPKEIEGVYEKIKAVSCKHHPIHGTDLTVIAVLGDHTGQLETSIFEVLPGVEKVSRIEKPFKLSARSVKPHGSIVEGVGGKKLVIMAGPCSVESEAQINKCAKTASGLGCGFLRGGAFKPRTSPFVFQGLKEEGLKLLAQAGKANNMKVVTEVVATEDVSLIAEYADILQIGARNMQNYRLLEVVGKTGKTILLKRGMAATIDEWLMAADYLLHGGSQVILCERGVRGFGNHTRFTLDVAAVPVVKKLSHLPIIIDPSHAAGNYAYVPALALAGIAAGADGLIIEIHPSPKEALSDGAQSLTFSDFSRLISSLSTVALAVGRSM